MKKLLTFQRYRKLAVNGLNVCIYKKGDFDEKSFTLKCHTTYKQHIHMKHRKVLKCNERKSKVSPLREHMIRASMLHKNNSSKKNQLWMHTLFHITTYVHSTTQFIWLMFPYRMHFIYFFSEQFNIHPLSELFIISSKKKNNKCILDEKKSFLNNQKIVPCII